MRLLANITPHQQCPIARCLAVSTSPRLLHTMLAFLLSSYSKHRLLLLLLMPPFRPLARLPLWFTGRPLSWASLPLCR